MLLSVLSAVVFTAVQYFPYRRFVFVLLSHKQEPSVYVYRPNQEFALSDNYRGLRKTPARSSGTAMRGLAGSGSEAPKAEHMPITIAMMRSPKPNFFQHGNLCVGARPPCPLSLRP